MVSKVLLKTVIELERQSRAGEGEGKTSWSSIPCSVPPLQRGGGVGIIRTMAAKEC